MPSWNSLYILTDSMEMAVWENWRIFLFHFALIASITIHILILIITKKKKENITPNRSDEMKHFELFSLQDKLCASANGPLRNAIFADCLFI